jgi:hypothetical protein
VGVPALAGSLGRAEYLASISAVTGAEGSLPRSHIDLISTRQTDTPIEVRDFVPVPLLENPLQSAPWDAREIAIDVPPGGSFDLLRFDVVMPKVATTWRVVAPASRRRIELPDVAAYGFPLSAGTVTVGVAAARIGNFDYAVLKERDVGNRSWDAYAVNAVDVLLP